MKKNYKELIENIINKKDYDEEELNNTDNLDAFFDILSDKEISILNYHYGLQDGIKKTFEDTKNKFKIEKSIILHIEETAFRKIKLLFAINNNSFIINADGIIEKFSNLLEIQKSYDNYYKNSYSDDESATTKFYKRVIEVAEKSKELNANKEKKLTIQNKTNLQ